MAELSLPPASVPISDGQGIAPSAWRRFFEGVFKRLGGAVDYVAFAYRAAQEAAAAGDLAGVAAIADDAYGGVGLLGSFPSGLSVTGVASAGTVAVSGHTRHYMLGAAPVLVLGAVIGPVDYNADYWIYYDQASRAGGSVNYQATKIYREAFASHDAPHRHFVAYLKTPATSGSADTTGQPALPVGYAGP